MMNYGVTSYKKLEYKVQRDAMYKKAEEGMISEGRDANLNLRAVWKSNQSATKLHRNFCLLLVCLFPGKFNRTRKTIYGKQKKYM